MSSHRVLRLHRQTVGSPVRLSNSFYPKFRYSKPIRQCPKPPADTSARRGPRLLSKPSMWDPPESCPVPSMATSGHTICARVNFAQTISVVRTRAFPARALLCEHFFSVRSRHFCRPHSRRVNVSRDDARWTHSPHGCHHRKLLNDFSGHTHTSYRCRACFGHGEASIVAGDENGAVWAWDLLDVSHSEPSCAPMSNLLFNAGQASST
jgi:hypothetical protein